MTTNHKPAEQQELASLLDKAVSDYEAGAKQHKGRELFGKPEQPITSPLGIKNIALNVATDEIVRCIAESRRYA